ncbi:hypothetical protein NYQ05_11315 [Novosphingobium humi]|nr:hypothetical protein [Novosphingobium humi]WJT00170.1 hypothetical protein NYQ05_11315 [Novosphingobium humi]
MSTALSMAVLAVILLVIGSAALWRRGVRKQAILMIVLAVILGANVAIWSLPPPAALSGKP